jgi:hypothetical protein
VDILLNFTQPSFPKFISFGILLPLFLLFLVERDVLRILSKRSGKTMEIFEGATQFEYIRVQRPAVVFERPVVSFQLPIFLPHFVFAPFYLVYPGVCQDDAIPSLASGNTIDNSTR